MMPTELAVQIKTRTLLVGLHEKKLGFVILYPIR
jgi:hypothetical protein